jgi:hypothetical protein
MYPRGSTANGLGVGDLAGCRDFAAVERWDCGLRGADGRVEVLAKALSLPAEPPDWEHRGGSGADL